MSPTLPSPSNLCGAWARLGGGAASVARCRRAGMTRRSRTRARDEPPGSWRRREVPSGGLRDGRRVGERSADACCNGHLLIPHISCVSPPSLIAYRTGRAARPSAEAAPCCPGDGARWTIALSTAQVSDFASKASGGRRARVRPRISRLTASSMISRTSSTPVREAASISNTSGSRSPEWRDNCADAAGIAVGPPVPSGPSQFSARAMMRRWWFCPPAHAGQHERVATRLMAKALRRMPPSTPARSGRRTWVGRYFRASTR